MSQLDNQLHDQGKAPSDRMRADHLESPPASEMPTAPFYEVEQLNTVPLSTEQSVKPVSQPAKAPGQYQQLEQPDGPPAFTFSPDRVSAQDLRQTPPQMFVSPRLRRKSRKPLAIVLVLLVLLIVVGGVSAWVVVWQPFSVPGITQPQQSFKDTQLGFSLLYPNGWRFQVDQRKAIVHF